MNNRKRQVLLTAQRLFVEKGFLSTSIQDIIEESQISKGTFYNYFSSKNECLMAILDHGRDETIIRRREISIDQSSTDKDVLSEQISIRLEVNRDHNLLPILEAVFHSGDPDLSAFAKRHHLSELSWLADRLVDVYGAEAKPHALDSAVLLAGMMQHMMHVLMVSSKEDFNAVILVKFIMRRMDSIIPSLIQTNDRLLHENSLSTLDDTDIKTKQELLSLLYEFNDILANGDNQRGSQYIEFIIEELHAENPRVYLLETVIRSVRESFTDTPYKLQSEELTAYLWRFLE